MLDLSRLSTKTILKKKLDCLIEFLVEHSWESDSVVLLSELITVQPNKITIDYANSQFSVEATTKLQWPVLVSDGVNEPDVQISKDVLMVLLRGDGLSYRVVGGTGITLSPDRYAHRNGFVRMANATFTPGAFAKLVIEPIHL